jgi:hypothetical protein
MSFAIDSLGASDAEFFNDLIRPGTALHPGSGGGEWGKDRARAELLSLHGHRKTRI